MSRYAGDLSLHFNKVSTRLWTVLDHVSPTPEFIDLQFQTPFDNFVVHPAQEVLDDLSVAIEWHFSRYIQPFMRSGPAIISPTQIIYTTVDGTNLKMRNTPADAGLFDGDRIFISFPKGAF